MSADWLIPEKDIPASFPRGWRPVIFVLGSNKECVMESADLPAEFLFIPRTSANIGSTVDYITPIGAILTVSRDDITETNLAATLLSTMRIPFIVCGAGRPTYSMMSPLISGAPYFDVSKTGENVHFAVEYLTGSIRSGRILRRRGISRAKL